MTAGLALELKPDNPLHAVPQNSTQLLVLTLTRTSDSAVSQVTITATPSPGQTVTFLPPLATLAGLVGSVTGNALTFDGSLDTAIANAADGTVQISVNVVVGGAGPVTFALSPPPVVPICGNVILSTPSVTYNSVRLTPEPRPCGLYSRSRPAIVPYPQSLAHSTLNSGPPLVPWCLVAGQIGPMLIDIEPMEGRRRLQSLQVVTGSTVDVDVRLTNLNVVPVTNYQLTVSAGSGSTATITQITLRGSPPGMSIAAASPWPVTIASLPASSNTTVPLAIRVSGTGTLNLAATGVGSASVTPAFSVSSTASSILSIVVVRG